MKACAINGYTHTPGAPVGWNPDRNGECGILPIIHRHDAHGNPESVSAWKPTREELQQLNDGGFVILSVVGWQVPVSIYTADRDAAQDMQP
jgi:hypothetical protein